MKLFSVGQIPEAQPVTEDDIPEWYDPTIDEKRDCWKSLHWLGQNYGLPQILSHLPAPTASAASQPKQLMQKPID